MARTLSRRTLEKRRKVRNEQQATNDTSEVIAPVSDKRKKNKKNSHKGKDPAESKSKKHVPVKVMLIDAFKDLQNELSSTSNDCKSFSLPEIKKKISLLFDDVDTEKLTPFILKVIKSEIGKQNMIEYTMEGEKKFVLVKDK